MFLAASWVGWVENLQPQTYFFSLLVFNDSAFIIQFEHKGYLNSWLYFIPIKDDIVAEN